MIECIRGHKTKSGLKRVYILYTPISISTLKKHTNAIQIRGQCASGCSNYNRKWSCPPHSKTFDTICKEFDSALLICMYMDVSEFDFIQHKYQKIRAANMVLKSLSNKASRNLEEYLEGYALLNGSCNLCNPCNGKLGLPCKKKDLMRYSLESTGINVETLLIECMNLKLQWYEKNCMPEYTSVVSCILYRENTNFDMMREVEEILDELSVRLPFC